MRRARSGCLPRTAAIYGGGKPPSWRRPVRLQPDQRALQSSEQFERGGKAPACHQPDVDQARRAIRPAAISLLAYVKPDGPNYDTLVRNRAMSSKQPRWRGCCKCDRNTLFPVERRGHWWRRGSGPERDDNPSPQTGVVAAIVLLVHVRGEIGLQDEPAEAFADQTADGNLALLGVSRNRRSLRSVDPKATTPNSQSPNFLVAVRSTLRKSGLQPFNTNGAGHAGQLRYGP